METLQVGKAGLAHIIHDGSWRNRAVATRDRCAEPRGREAYLKQYVDQPSGELACLDAVPTASGCVATALVRSSALGMIVARRENTHEILTSVSAIAAETVMIMRTRKGVVV
jgi:hypothetical protein